MAGLSFGEVFKQAEAAGFGQFKDQVPGTYLVQFTSKEAMERKGYHMIQLRYTVIEVLDGGEANSRGSSYSLPIFFPKEGDSPGKMTAFAIAVSSLGADIEEIKKLPFDIDHPSAPKAVANLIDESGTWQVSYVQNGQYINARGWRRVESAPTPAANVKPAGSFKAARGRTEALEAPASEAPVEPEPELAEAPEATTEEAPAEENGQVKATTTGRRRAV